MQTDGECVLKSDDFRMINGKDIGLDRCHIVFAYKNGFWNGFYCKKGISSIFYLMPIPVIAKLNNQPWISTQTFAFFATLVGVASLELALINLIQYSRLPLPTGICNSIKN